MRVVVQRSLKSSVSVDGKLINKIDSGLMLLVGIAVDDTTKDIDWMVNKVLNLRIFDDQNGVMNKSILDVGGEILSISQFTLQADTRKGNRPSYINAMKGEDAKKIYEYFNSKLNEQIPTYPGVFGAEMIVSIENDGPITIIIDTKEKKD
jgi:D-tyrosyl-tRNA(Tyr) deacylase